MTKTRYLFLAVLCFFICFACNRSSKSDNAPYSTAIVFYPDINRPWETMHFYSVPPESFTQDVLYKDHLNKLEITDTVFINRLTKSANSRIIQNDSNSDSFDTWFMVLLTSRNNYLVDTLAVWHNFMWFNRDIYIDSVTSRIITEEIIRHDRDFAINITDYYDNGKWYPYLGKKMTNELLGNTTDQDL